MTMKRKQRLTENVCVMQTDVILLCCSHKYLHCVDITRIFMMVGTLIIFLIPKKNNFKQIFINVAKSNSASDANTFRCLHTWYIVQIEAEKKSGSHIKTGIYTHQTPMLGSMPCMNYSTCLDGSIVLKAQILILFFLSLTSLLTKWWNSQFINWVTTTTKMKQTHQKISPTNISLMLLADIFLGSCNTFQLYRTAHVS